VGNAAYQGANSPHLLRLQELGFEALALGDVEQRAMDSRLPLPHHRRRQAFQPDERAVY
jgi:hypothetical protein